MPGIVLSATDTKMNKPSSLKHQSSGSILRVSRVPHMGTGEHWMRGTSLHWGVVCVLVATHRAAASWGRPACVSTTLGYCHPGKLAKARH